MKLTSSQSSTSKLASSEGAEGIGTECKKTTSNKVDSIGCNLHLDVGVCHINAKEKQHENHAFADQNCCSSGEIIFADFNVHYYFHSLCAHVCIHSVARND